MDSSQAGKHGGGVVRTALAYLERFPAWGYPLVLAVVVFQPGELNIGPDAAWYWTLGKNIADGLGYVGSEWQPEVRRGPGLPLLIAAALSWFGDDVSRIAWLMRACFVACGMATYAVAARWFGRPVGAAAACGLFANWNANAVASGIGVDVIVVVLVLVAILALDRTGWRAALGAGLAFAALALTKEASLIVVLPLALAAAFESDRVRRLSDLAVAVGIGGFALASWWLWADGADLFARRVASFAGGGGAAPSLGAAIEGLVSFGRTTAEWIALAPLFLIGWLTVAISGVAGSSRDRLLLFLGLSVLPIAVLQGLYELRSGQTFLLLPLSFIALGRAVQLGAERFAPALASRSVALAGVAFVSVGFSEASVSHWVQSWRVDELVDADYRTINPVAVPWGKPVMTSWSNQVVDEAAQWLADNVSADEVIVSDWYWADSIYLALGARQPIHRLPYVRSRNVSHMALESSLPMPAVDRYPPVLFAFVQGERTDPRHPDAWVNALSEPLLFARLEQVEADWLIVTRRRMMFADYFDASPSFELAHVGLGELLRIYRVRRPLQATPFDIGIRSELGVYLDELAATDPKAYDALIRDYFQAQLGVSAADVVEWRDALREAAAASAPD